MRPQRRSTKKAEGVSQGGLRSHSDNHQLARLQRSVAGWDGQESYPGKAEGGGSRSSRCGERGTPRRAVAYLVPQKGKGSPSCPSCPLSRCWPAAHHRQTGHCENQRLRGKLHKCPVYPFLPEQQTLGTGFKAELRLLTDVDSSHFPLAAMDPDKHTNISAEPRCTTVASMYTIQPPQ